MAHEQLPGNWELAARVLRQTHPELVNDVQPYNVMERALDRLWPTGGAYVSPLFPGKIRINQKYQHLPVEELARMIRHEGEHVKQQRERGAKFNFVDTPWQNMVRPWHKRDFEVEAEKASTDWFNGLSPLERALLNQGRVPQRPSQMEPALEP